MRFLLSLFLLLSFPLFSDEMIDISQIMEKRTKQYPLKGYNKICLFTPRRTGSTLVYNVLRFLFEKGDREKIVKKTHSLKKDKRNVAYVFTMRNPVDACFSFYRAKGKETQKIAPLIHDQMQCWETLGKLIEKKRKTVLLKYEEFVNDIDFLFAQLEKEFSIKIDEKDKALLRNALSKENVLKNIAQFNDFKQLDKKHHFHGNHIDQGEIDEETRLRLKKEIAQQLIPYKSKIEKWGYKI